ncbi:MAG TPA: helix-turn-helix domain-containing protein [bacterium]|nr:helix-turn-helix domain-containing protein [bacterium]
MTEATPSTAARHALLRLFFEYPFPVLPLVDEQRALLGAVRRAAAEAYAGRSAAEPLTVFLERCRGEFLTGAEEDDLRARMDRDGRAVPLLDLTGTVIDFWRGGAPPWAGGTPAGEPLVLAPSGLWPFAAQYDARGGIRCHSRLPGGWRLHAGRPRLADIAWRLETARRDGITHGYFRRAGRQYRFVLDPGDRGGLCRINPLFPVEEWLEYLQEGNKGLPDIMAACEGELLREVLASGAGRQQAANLLGIPRQTLTAKMERYGL